MSGIVAIVGRPNVGKSTLFNRLIKEREAIVDAVSGVTRDRHYGKANWNAVEFSVIDTGGYLENSDDVFQEQIHSQVQLAIDEADVIIFLTDLDVGLISLDEDVARILRKNKKPVLLAVNKSDVPSKYFMASEFYQLGFKYLFPISAINGSGTGELLDQLVTLLPKTIVSEEKELPKIAVIGRPNVGKSSLINTLIGKDRFIVTDVAGTTRDATSLVYNQYGYEFELVDTAGIRRKTKVKENIEFYSVMRSIRAIENSEVCILLIDATQAMESQDKRIFWLAHRNKKAIIIAVNKWDLIEKETNTTKEFEKTIRKQLEPFDDVPIIFISVLNKQRIYKLLQLTMAIYQKRAKRITTSILNDKMLPVFKQTPPPMKRGNSIKIKYCMQLPSPRPQFVFYTNHPEAIKQPYARFVENQLRKHFDFQGIPIDIYFRKK